MLYVYRSQHSVSQNEYPKVICGSVVRNASGFNAVMVFGPEQFKEIAGRAFDNSKDCISVINADGNASGAVVTGVIYDPNTKHIDAPSERHDRRHKAELHHHIGGLGEDNQTAQVGSRRRPIAASADAHEAVGIDKCRRCPDVCGGDHEPAPQTNCGLQMERKDELGVRGRRVQGTLNRQHIVVAFDMNE